MSAKIIPCAKCGEDIKVTDTSSLYKPDGEPYKIYCGPCFAPVDLKLEARLESVKELVILTHLQAATGLFLYWSDRTRPLAQSVVANADWRTNSSGLVSLKAHQLVSQQLKDHWGMFDAFHNDFANSTTDPEQCAQKLLPARKLSFARVYVGMTREIVNRLFEDAEELDQELNEGRYGVSLLGTQKRNIKQALDSLGSMLEGLAGSLEQQIAMLMED